MHAPQTREAGRSRYAPTPNSPHAGKPSRSTRTRRTRAQEQLAWQTEKEGLDPSVLAVALALADHFQPDRPVHPSIARISGMAKVCPATVHTCLNEIECSGLWTREQRRDPFGYKLPSLWWPSPELFERAGLPNYEPPPAPPPPLRRGRFLGPAYSNKQRSRTPKFGDERDPLSSLDRDSESGSLVHPENERERRAPARTAPVFVEANEDPAFADLARTHAAAHAERYRLAFEQAGESYTAQLAGTIREEHRADVVAELRNLAGRALAIAQARGRYDLTADAIRVELTARIVHGYMAQERPYLRDHKHPLGCLWGRGGDDGKPCDLLAIGPRVVEEWCDALAPGKALPGLAALLAMAPPVAPTAEELVEVREACVELRAAVRDLPEPPPLVESLPAPEPAEDMRAALERIDAESRHAAITKARAQRAKGHRGGRIQSGTRPRARLAFLAALMTLAGTTTREDDAPELRAELGAVDEAPAAHEAPHRGPPLRLRDVRARPFERTPRRPKPPPRWAS